MLRSFNENVYLAGAKALAKILVGGTKIPMKKILSLDRH